MLMDDIVPRAIAPGMVIISFQTFGICQVFTLSHVGVFRTPGTNLPLFDAWRGFVKASEFRKNPRLGSQTFEKRGKPERVSYADGAHRSAGF